MKLILGDCLEKLKDLDDNSVDSIVTDPPYGFSFMGKKWDYDVPSIDIWKECFRVLKFGGHLLAFGGSRTYHRLAVNVEDAGFEIRDQIMWIYGSGFPKSHNVGKAVDKIQGNKRDVIRKRKDGVAKINDNGIYRINALSKNEVGMLKEYDETKGNSQWEGWGTALKPAHEPIVMARKPLSEKSIADNVLKWGTGAINIDESRIGSADTRSKASMTALGQNSGWNKHNNKEVIAGSECGRFPANIMFDEEASKILDEQSGISKSVTSKRGVGFSDSKIYGKGDLSFDSTRGYNDKAGASRFFYCSKTSKKDRDEGMAEFKEKKWVQFSTKNNTSGEPSNWSKDRQTSYKNIHPTVKPTKLMCYLVNLVTPKGGIVLDPFMGSGSTGKACVQKGFDFIGIEREEEYIQIANARIEYEQKKMSEKLF